MKTIIEYKELSQLTEGKFIFTRISETELRVSGRIMILVIPKDIDFTLKIERVGYSSITLSVSDPNLIKNALLFVQKFKKAVTDFGGGSVKIDLKEIPELSEITKKLKLDSLKFEESGVIIDISQRP